MLQSLCAAKVRYITCIFYICPKRSPSKFNDRTLYMFKQPIAIPQAMQAYQLMRVGSALLSGVIMANMGLSLEDLGYWEDLMFIASWAALLGVNGFLQGVAPLYETANTLNRKALLRLVFWLFVGMGLLMATIVVATVLYRGQVRTGDLWLATYLLLHLPTLPVETVWMLRRRTRPLLWWGVLLFGGQIAIVTSAIYFKWGITGAVQGMAVWAGIRLIYALYLLKPWQNWPQQHQLSRSYLHLTWPLVSNAWVGQLIGLFDAWWVQLHWSSAAVFAIFRYGSRELPWALALSTALGTAMVPALSADLSQGLAELKQRGTRLMHWVFPITIVLSLCADWWFPLVFSSALAKAIPLFQVYLLITISRVLLPNSILIALGDTRAIFYVGWMELALKIGLGIVFSYVGGLTGLALSMVICCWFEKLVLAFWLSRKHNIRVNQWLSLSWLLIYAGLLLAAVLI
jgi:O-antigen/teichoic acid export membrane protein